MNLTTSDRLEIHELINLHGHLVDAGAFERLHELFTNDVVYDLRDFGGAELRGIDAVAEASIALGDANPLAHHVTNVLITSAEGPIVRVMSKGIGIRSDGSAGSVTYQDEVRKDAAGWRISRRHVSPRRRPLQP